MEGPPPEKTRKTEVAGRSLPRPRSTEFLELECLEPKVRSPDSAHYSGSLDELMPERPAKKSTPRAGASSLLFKPENGKFTPHRIPSMENLHRGLSFLGGAFCSLFLRPSHFSISASVV